MAYSISGFVYDQYDNPISNCYYQFLYLSSDSTSNLFVWSDIYQTDDYGYYSHDLHDSDMLDIHGTFNTNDQVLITSWLGDSTRSHLITECSDWIHTIVDSNKEIIIQNLKIYPVQKPKAHFIELPSEGIIEEEYYLINNSDVIWNKFEVDYNTIFYQHCNYNQIEIFYVVCIKESIWIYGDSTSLDVYEGLHDTSYSWNEIGVYNVQLTIVNHGDLSDVYTEQIIIKYTINVDLNWSPQSAKINNPIQFINTSIDNWNRVTKYRWEIYDGDILSPPSDIYEGDHSLSPRYLFDGYPDRCVILIAFWNDGFENKQTPITKCVIFYPIADFEKIDTDCSPTYRDRSIAGLSPKIYYWWKVFEQTSNTTWKLILCLEGDDPSEIKFHFPHIGTFKIWHQIKDSNNLIDSIEKLYNIDICPTGGGGGGGAKYYTGYPYKKPHVEVHAKFKKKIEKDKIKLQLKFIQTENKQGDI